MWLPGSPAAAGEPGGRRPGRSGPRRMLFPGSAAGHQRGRPSTELPSRAPQRPLCAPLCSSALAASPASKPALCRRVPELRRRQGLCPAGEEAPRAAPVLLSAGRASGRWVRCRLGPLLWAELSALPRRGSDPGGASAGPRRSLVSASRPLRAPLQASGWPPWLCTPPSPPRGRGAWRRPPPAAFPGSCRSVSPCERFLLCVRWVGSACLVTSHLLVSTFCFLEKSLTVWKAYPGL